MLKLKSLDVLGQAFSSEMPHADSLTKYLDMLIPVVKPWGEDLREGVFLSRGWLEFSDDDNFHDVILHFFNKEGEYLRSVNGNVTAGSWRLMETPNKLLLEHDENELFDLAFSDKNFFILKKHGDQARLGQPKYFVMVHEPLGRKLEWRDAMELLYNTYRSNNSFYFTLAAIVLVIIAIVLIYSLG